MEETDRKFAGAYDSHERAVRGLPWSEFRTTVHIEVYRVKCPARGGKIEKVPLLPSKAPIQQALRGCGGPGMRECVGAAGSSMQSTEPVELRMWNFELDSGDHDT